MKTGLDTGSYRIHGPSKIALGPCISIVIIAAITSDTSTGTVGRRLHDAIVSAIVVATIASCKRRPTLPALVSDVIAAMITRNADMVCKFVESHFLHNPSLVTLTSILLDMIGDVAQWLERRSSAGELFLSCARLQRMGDQYYG